MEMRYVNDNKNHLRITVEGFIKNYLSHSVDLSPLRINSPPVNLPL